MGSVWVVMPSKRPPEEAEKCLSVWREMGYRVALWRDDVGDTPEYDKYWRPGVGSCCDMILGPNPGLEWDETTWFRSQYGAYPGYARAVNELIRQLIMIHGILDWFVAAGDDMLPDPNKRADQIARECSEHFMEAAPFNNGLRNIPSIAATFGVMQPTGDRDWGDRRGPYCDFVAGSPWMGREWCQRINQGNGPLWPDYFHMGVDEELQAVAIKYGVFWQRPDLIHKHLNWGRPTDGRKMVDVSEMPDFLVKANSPAEWNKYKRIFKERSEAGFPGSEPL